MFFLLKNKLPCIWNVWTESESREGDAFRCWNPGVVQNTLRAKYWRIWRSHWTVEQFSSAWGHPRFSEFHRDITEECSSVDKQHSWGVIKKPEIFFHRPYFPDKSREEQRWRCYSTNPGTPGDRHHLSRLNIYIFSQNRWWWRRNIAHWSEKNECNTSTNSDVRKLQLIELKTCSRQGSHIVNLLTLYHKWCVTIILEWSFYTYSQIFQ